MSLHSPPAACLLAFLIFHHRGTFYFFGGLLLVIGMVMEWIVGNTFISVVFGAYGAFWLTYGATLTPGYNALNAYTEGLSGDALTEAMAAYHSTFGIPPVSVTRVQIMGISEWQYLQC